MVTHLIRCSLDDSSPKKTRAYYKPITNLDELEQFFYVAKAYLDDGMSPEIELWVSCEEDQTIDDFLQMVREHEHYSNQT